MERTYSYIHIKKIEKFTLLLIFVVLFVTLISILELTNDTRSDCDTEKRDIFYYVVFLMLYLPSPLRTHVCIVVAL